MATIVTKTVKSSGGDYTSLSAWEAGQQADITAAGNDTIQIAECYSFEDTTSVQISGWTTDSTHYIKIYTPTAERHDGKWNDTKYRLNITGSSVHSLEGGTDYIWIDGLQISLTLNADSGSGRAVYFLNATGEFKMSNCILKGVKGAYTPTVFDAFRCYNATPNYIIKVWNCIAYDFDAGTGYGFHTSFEAQGAVSGSYIYNCTVRNCKYAYILNTNVIARNNISQDVATDGFYATSTYHASCSNNCSDIASDAPGASSQTGEVTFVNEGAGDLHLDASDTVARGNGADLSGIFTDDIDGDTRSAWDIGADEYSSGGTTYNESTAITTIAASTVSPSCSMVPAASVQAKAATTASPSCLLVPAASVQAKAAAGFGGFRDFVGSVSITAGVVSTTAEIVGFAGNVSISGKAAAAFSPAVGMLATCAISARGASVFSPAINGINQMVINSAAGLSLSGSFVDFNVNVSVPAVATFSGQGNTDVSVAVEIQGRAQGAAADQVIFSGDIALSAGADAGAFANLIANGSVSIAATVDAGEGSTSNILSSVDLTAVSWVLMEYFAGDTASLILLSCILADQYGIDISTFDETELISKAAFASLATADVSEAIETIGKIAVTFGIGTNEVLLAVTMAVIMAADVDATLTAEELLSLSLVTAAVFTSATEMTESLSEVVRAVDSYQYDVETLLIMAAVAGYLTTTVSETVTVEGLVTAAILSTVAFGHQVQLSGEITISGKVGISFDTGAYSLETVVGVKISTLFEDVYSIMTRGRLGRDTRVLSSTDRDSFVPIDPGRKGVNKVSEVRRTINRKSKYRG